MVELYGIRISELPDAGDAKERFACAKTWCRRHPTHRENDVARAGIGGLLLLRAAGITGEIAYTDRGRPYVPDSNVDFNITHTNRHVFVAIDRRSDPTQVSRVGIDAEEMGRETRSLDALVARWFSDSERKLFEKSPDRDTFLRIWTRKEALVKWTGEGIGAAVNRDTCAASVAYGVAFWDFDADGAIVSLCTQEGNSVAGEIRMLSGKDLTDFFEQEEQKGKEREC